MRARLVDKVGITTVVAFAVAVVVLYSLWGASILQAQQQAAANPATHLSTNR